MAWQNVWQGNAVWWSDRYMTDLSGKWFENVTNCKLFVIYIFEQYFSLFSLIIQAFIYSYWEFIFPIYGNIVQIEWSHSFHAVLVAWLHSFQRHLSSYKLFIIRCWIDSVNSAKASKSSGVCPWQIEVVFRGECLTWKGLRLHSCVNPWWNMQREVYKGVSLLSFHLRA